MGTLNVPQAEAAFIKSIDTQHLSSLVRAVCSDLPRAIYVSWPATKGMNRPGFELTVGTD